MYYCGLLTIKKCEESGYQTNVDWHWEKILLVIQYTAYDSIYWGNSEVAEIFLSVSLYFSQRYITR